MYIIRSNHRMLLSYSQRLAAFAGRSSPGAISTGLLCMYEPSISVTILAMARHRTPILLTYIVLATVAWGPAIVVLGYHCIVREVVTTTQSSNLFIPNSHIQVFSLPP